MSPLRFLLVLLAISFANAAAPSQIGMSKVLSIRGGAKAAPKKNIIETATDVREAARGGASSRARARHAPPARPPPANFH